MTVVALGEMVDFVGGGTPSKDESLFWGGDIPWVSVKDLKSKVINETIDTITPQGVEGSSTRVIEKGALIIATRMAVGKAVILGVDAAINQDLKAVRIKGELDRDYLFYFLKQAAPYFERVSTGATVKGIKLEHLRNLGIPLPPMEEQKRIAGILDEADRVRKKTQALIDKYDELAQSLFLDMFGDPVTNPKGWEVVQLGEKLVAKGGKRLPKGADYSVSPTEWPYLRVADMRVNAVELSELKFLTEEVQSKISRYTISKDDVFISIAGTIGVAGWIPDELDGCNLTENAAKIVGLREARLRKEFLSFYLNSHFVQREIEARTMAVGVPKLALFRIESLPLMLPPLELQGEFLVRLGQIRASKIHLEQNDEEGNNLFEALLQEAFKGELT